MRFIHTLKKGMSICCSDTKDISMRNLYAVLELAVQ